MARSVPAMTKLPLLNSMSAAAASSTWLAILLALLDDLGGELRRSPVPLCISDFDPPLPPPAASRSLSPCTSDIFSTGMPSLMQPAGLEKGIGIISAGSFKDPTDPQWQGTPEYKEWVAWMQKYNTSGNVADNLTVSGYTVTQAMVAVLKACGNNLTRANLMKQAASINDLKLPMLLPGITVSTSANDFAPIKQMQLMKFDGTTWRLFGDVISASSS